MHILQTDRIEMPTRLDAKRPGLLINVHLGETCHDQGVMDGHARELIKKESAAQYASIAVVFWLQADGQRERLHTYEERAGG